MNVKHIDLKTKQHAVEITVTYGAGQQVNVVTTHPDVSTAAAMAGLEVIKKMKYICDKEAFDATQKEQEKQFGSFIEPLPVMLEDGS